MSLAMSLYRALIILSCLLILASSLLKVALAASLLNWIPVESIWYQYLRTVWNPKSEPDTSLRKTTLFK